MEIPRPIEGRDLPGGDRAAMDDLQSQSGSRPCWVLSMQPTGCYGLGCCGQQSRPVEHTGELSVVLCDSGTSRGGLCGSDYVWDGLGAQ